jgi:hypothetical protein
MAKGDEDTAAYRPSYVRQSTSRIAEVRIGDVWDSKRYIREL